MPMTEDEVKAVVQQQLDAQLIPVLELLGQLLQEMKTGPGATEPPAPPEDHFRGVLSAKAVSQILWRDHGQLIPENYRETLATLPDTQLRKLYRAAYPDDQDSLSQLPHGHLIDLLASALFEDPTLLDVLR